MKKVPFYAAVLLAGVFFGAPPAGAAVQEQSAPITFSNAANPASGSGTTPVVDAGVLAGTFKPFDPALGTLTACTVTFNATVALSGTADSTALADGSIGATMGGTFVLDGRTFNGTGGGIEPVTAPPGDNLSATLAMEGFTYTFRPEEAGQFYDPAILSSLTGQQDFLLEFQASDNMVTYSNILGLTISGNAQFTLIYEYEPAPEPPAVTGMVRQTATGDVTLTWKSVSGTRYAVEASPDLAAWSEVAADVSAAAGSETSWTETGIPAGTGSRFYRVRRKAE